MQIDGERLAAVSRSARAPLRRVWDRLSGARAAAVQFQSAAGCLPGVRGVRQHRGDGHGAAWCPIRRKSIREGAIAPWNAPSYAHELEELLALADDYELAGRRAVCRAHGRAAAADRRRCAGAELWRPRRFLHLAGAAQIQNAPAGVLEPLAIVLAVPGVRRCATAARGAGRARRRQELCRRVPHENSRRARILRRVAIARMAAADRAATRRGCAVAAGVPGRRRRRLSGARSVAADAQRRRSAARRPHGDARLQPGRHAVRARRAVGRPASGRRRPAGRRDSSSCKQRGNTVVVVEHEEEIIRRADQVVEFGPGAGEDGGQVVFQGTPQAIGSQLTTAARATGSPAGAALGSQRTAPLDGARLDQAPRRPRQQSARIVTVEFPLGVLCLVTGVSGAGKSTLVDKTLYPALARQLHRDTDPADAAATAGVRRRARHGAAGRRDSHRPKPDRPLAAIQPGHVHEGVRSDPRAVCRAVGGAGPRPVGQPFQLQRRRRPLRDLPRRRHAGDRHAVHGRRVHAVPRVRRPALSAAGAGGEVSRPRYRRSARHDGPRGVHISFAASARCRPS